MILDIYGYFLILCKFVDKLLLLVHGVVRQHLPIFKCFSEHGAQKVMTIFLTNGCLKHDLPLHLMHILTVDVEA